MSLNFFICIVVPHLRVGTWRGQRKEGPRAGHGSGVVWPVLGLATFHGLRYGCNHSSQSYLEPQAEVGPREQKKLRELPGQTSPRGGCSQDPLRPQGSMWLVSEALAKD